MTGAEAAAQPLREALRAYGLERARLSRIPAGMINTCYRVDDGGCAYVLKWYRPGLVASLVEGLDFVYSTQESLRSSGLPIPAVMPLADGSFVLETAEGSFTLSEFAAGKQFARGAMPPGCAWEMGATLARIHAVLADLPPGEPRRLPSPEEALARIEGLLRIAEARRKQQPIDHVAIAALRAKLAALEEWTNAPSGFIPHWTHGDFQDSNVIFAERGDEVVAVVDWDALRYTNKGYEIMRAFAFSFPDGAAGGLEFLEGYVRTSDLGPDEVEALVPLWDYTRTARTWPIEVRYEQPEVYQDRWDVFIQEPSGWWEAHKARVHRALLSFPQTSR